MSVDSNQVLNEARTLAQAGKNDDARMLLLELLKEDSDNQTALLMLGGSYFVDDKLREAEMAFERLILLEPGLGIYSIGLFNTLWKLGRQEEALEEIKRFLEVADKSLEQETVQQYMAITQKLATGLGGVDGYDMEDGPDEQR
jgi:predicted Zn-dependent protease